VTVLDLFGDIATVMVRSEPFVEYVHLARFGDRWLIVNALYYVL
jgi:Putative lumazine-binding